MNRQNQFHIFWQPKRGDILGMENIYGIFFEIIRQRPQIPPKTVGSVEKNNLEIIYEFQFFNFVCQIPVFFWIAISKKKILIFTVYLCQIFHQIEKHRLVAGSFFADHPDVYADFHVLIIS